MYKRGLIFHLSLAVFQSIWIISQGAIITENSVRVPAPSYCSMPTIADNFDADWIHDNAKEGWHLTMGNSAARKHISQILLGKNLTDNADYSKMCSKFSINIDHVDGKFDGKYSGYGKQSAEWNCNFVQEKFKCDYLSNTNQNYGDHGSAYVSYFDEKEVKNIFVAVICFEDGDVAWYAASLTKTLTEDDKKTISKHLNDIGIDASSVTMYSEENCK